VMANPSTCTGGRRNLAENPARYRTIPHGWAFRPYINALNFDRLLALGSS
jgi:hypothetical protein